MRKLTRSILFKLLTLITLLMLLLLFMVFTTPGLSILTRLGVHYFPGSWHIQGIQGRLWDKFSINELEYEQGSLKIIIKDIIVMI